VVVNKVDLVGDGELAEVVAFTARVVAGRLGQPVPVFPLSALAARRRSDGFDTFAAWLAAELESHGSAHALASTARALRREATALRGSGRVASLRPQPPMVPWIVGRCHGRDRPKASMKHRRCRGEQAGNTV
jgi:hypothetical protein